MKHKNSNSFVYAIALSSIVIICSIAVPAYCQDDSVALMMQLSPAEGGKVNIEPGVHTYDKDSVITLRAVPNPGYQFVYWIGNVTEASSSTTTVNIDGPKIVIAVFEKSKFEILAGAEQPQILSGNGGLYRSPVESGIDISGDEEIVYRAPSYNTTSSTSHNPPVPGGNDQPVPNNPTPEPATILLLSGGIFALNKKIRHKNNS